MKNKVIIIAFLIMLLIPYNVSAEENEPIAEDISKEAKIEYNNKKITKLNDDSTNTKITFAENSEIKITSEKEIGSIYIKYESSSKKGTILYNDETYNIGENGFLHEYIKLEKNTNELILKYNEEVQISEIYSFTKGTVPSWVQQWNTQKGEVDLMLFSTHSDDEHLFFAGLLPAHVAKGLNVQVIYVTNHNETPTRLHEQLDGLWSVGITNYPIISQFPDAYSESLKGAVSNLKSAGYAEEDVIKFQVELIRKYKPLVVVGHDENGEYKHGQHILNTDALKQAIINSNDTNYDVETVEQYGIWQTPKVYLHLYEQNQITMNYDEPLEYFKGKTAYEMSKIAYKYHKSQQYTWFTKWLNGANNSYTSATQIKTYSPLKFGLYYTTVGEDTQKNDMFENINQEEFRPKEEPIIEEEKQTTEEILNNKSNINISNKEKANIIIIILILILALIIVLKFIIKKHKNN